MKRMIKTIAVVLLCGLLAAPAVDARQERGRNNAGQSRTHQAAPSRNNNSSSRPTGSRPGNGGAGSNKNNNSRPDNNSRPGNNNRPSTNGRPGNSGRPPGSNDRPGNNRPGGNKPGQKPGHNPGGHKPGPPPAPHPSHKPGPPPGHHYGHHYGHHHGHGPVRPLMPPHHPFCRPVPPPSWHPAPGWRPFETMLGITIGTSFAYALNEIIHDGYTINSYNDNVIYLSNVAMLNMQWPDAVLYFNDYGQLYASSYIYSSAGYSMNRYNVAYSSLTSVYGLPVSTQTLNNGVETTWWGTNNQFIRLSYSSEFANNGTLRYYTTLSYGNYRD